MSHAVKRRPTHASIAWLIVASTNLIIATHYGAIVSANETNLANGTRGSFLLMTPWRDSVATLTFLRGDLWIRYASLVFLATALFEYVLKDSSRAPSWLRLHYVTVRRVTFAFGLALSVPLLITGVLWGLSIAFTLALFAVALTLVVTFLLAA